MSSIMEDSECTKCKHSHYDHIEWRKGAPGVNCRVIQCECESFSFGCANDLLLQRTIEICKGD